MPVLTSFARRAGMPGRHLAGIAPRRAVRVRGPLHPHAASCRRSVFTRREPSGRALSSFISELASHEVPGFGALALPSSLGLEALASASAIARDHGVSASGRQWRSCLRRHGNLLVNQVTRRGHLYPYKGIRGARIVSARRGELMRSFWGA